MDILLKRGIQAMVQILLHFYLWIEAIMTLCEDGV